MTDQTSAWAPATQADLNSLSDTVSAVEQAIHEAMEGFRAGGHEISPEVEAAMCWRSIKEVARQAIKVQQAIESQARRAAGDNVH